MDEKKISITSSIKDLPVHLSKKCVEKGIISMADALERKWMIWVSEVVIRRKYWKKITSTEYNCLSPTQKTATEVFPCPTFSEILDYLSDTFKVDVILEKLGRKDWSFKIKWNDPGLRITSGKGLKTEDMAISKALTLVIDELGVLKLEDDDVDEKIINIDEKYEIDKDRSTDRQIILKRKLDYEFISDKLKTDGWKNLNEKIYWKTECLKKLMEVANYLNYNDPLSKDEKWYFYVTGRDITTIRFDRVKDPDSVLPTVTFRTKELLEKCREILHEQIIITAIDPIV